MYSQIFLWMCGACILLFAALAKLRGFRLAVGVTLPVFLLSSVIVGALWNLDEQKQAKKKRTVSQSPKEKLDSQRPALVPRDGYVTSKKCRECHAHNYDTWHASYHRTMTQMPSEDNVIGDFDDVQMAYHGRSYHLQKRGDEFWVKMDDPDAKPGQKVERQVALVTGSHHMQIYWYATGNTRLLGQLPVHYLRDEQRWVPESGTLMMQFHDFHSNTGLWNMRCLQCHSTHSRTRPQRGGADTLVAELGISCEACHGPAEDHLAFHRQNASGKQDQIVNPGKLNHRRASEICGMCHSYTVAPNSAIEEEEMRRGFFYRPGERLEDSFVMIRKDDETRNHLVREANGSVVDLEKYMDERFWADGMVRVAGREFNGMSESACYKEGEMSCLSCHSMHKPTDDPRTLKEWANDQLKAGMDGDQACLQCHQQEEYRSSKHTHHPASSSGARCYNCHMPHTSYGLLKALRSHQISSPDVSSTLNTGRPNACNLCHLDKTLTWSADHLKDWYGIEKPELPTQEQEVASAVSKILTGDAGQRALIAWHMGWPEAREVSGEDWQAPYLLQLLDDPYEAVRFIAYRSLRQLKGFEDFKFDYVGPAEQRSEEVGEGRKLWQKADTRRSDKAVLIDDQGRLDMAAFSKLLQKRDDREVHLLE